MFQVENPLDFYRESDDEKYMMRHIRFFISMVGLALVILPFTNFDRVHLPEMQKAIKQGKFTVDGKTFTDYDAIIAQKRVVRDSVLNSPGGPGKNTEKEIQRQNNMWHELKDTQKRLDNNYKLLNKIMQE